MHDTFIFSQTVTALAAVAAASAAALAAAASAPALIPLPKRRPLASPPTAPLPKRRPVPSPPTAPLPKRRPLRPGLQRWPEEEAFEKVFGQSVKEALTDRIQGGVAAKGKGDHGEDIPEDMDVLHYWRFRPAR